MPSINFDLNDVKPLAQALGLGQAPNTTAPPVNALPTPPMPLPPVPAQAGFSQWIADPKTQNKIADGIVVRGTPLFAPPAPPVAAAQPTASNLMPPGWTPPRPPGSNLMPPPAGGSAAPPDPYSYLKPPASTGGSGGAAPAAAGPGAQAQTAQLYSPPAASAPTAPASVPAPAAASAATQLLPYQNKLQTDQAELQRQQTTGSGVSQIKNPWLRTLARIGDVAGSIVAPGIATAIPGTTYHHDLTMAQQGQRVQGDRQDIQDAMGAQQSAATLAHTLAETGDIASKSQQQLAVHGLKSVTDENGKTSVVPDTDSPVYKANQDKDAKLQQQTELIGAQIDDTKAQKELRDAQTAFNNAKADPNSPLFRQTQQRLVTAQQNASAASVRAKAYMGNYMQHAYNTGLNGETLAGAPQIVDDSGNQSTVGSTNASNAIKQQKTVGSFNDLQGSVGNARKALTDFFGEGGSLSDPTIVSAMNDPKSMIGKVVNGQIVKGNLSDKAISAINAVRQLHEQAGILRSTTGGTASEAGAQRILDTVPGAGDANNEALNKLDEQDKVLSRLAPGQTKVSGGLNVKRNGSVYAPPPPSGAGMITVQPPPPSKGMITVQIPGMPPGQIHASQQANFLRDNPGAKVVSSGR
jgi:hypothetical protein